MCTACGSDKYVPCTPPAVLRYSFACSSDQKNIDFRQKASIILGSFRRSKSTIGAKITGSDPAVSTRYFNSLSISIEMGCPQWAHSVSIRKLRCSFRNCPCTKGTAIASTPQAAYSFSPELKVTRCGVGSTVTG